MTLNNTTSDKNFWVVSNKPESPWAKTVQDALAPLGQAHFATEAEAVTQIGQYSCDLIIIASGDIEGEIGSLVQKIHEVKPDVPLVVTTNSPTWRRAREVFLAGATDYIRRTLDKEKILSFYQNVLQNPPPTPASTDISDP
jgi:DNA-binding NtrC family response regulator